MSNIFANRRKPSTFGDFLPEVRIHYLGRASFILQFGNGISVLTDYDPAFTDIHLDIATCSHTNLDHYSSDRHSDIVHVLTRHSFQGAESLCFNDVKVIPVLTNDRAKQENVGFVFAYHGMTIVHPGDIREDIVRIHEQTVQAYFTQRFPKTIDLLFIPIGGNNELFDALTAFIELFQPKRVIPMQYQSLRAKEDFLDFLTKQNAASGTQYQLERVQGAQYTLTSGTHVSSSIMVISLDPQPFSGDTYQ